jgi:hypothetical protein
MRWKSNTTDFVATQYARIFGATRLVQMSYSLIYGGIAPRIPKVYKR